MSLLTANQVAAIQAGARVRQVWKIHVPRSSGSTTFDATTIHDDDDTTKNTRVVDAGTREVFAYNVSLREPGKLEIGSYTIEVDNRDGYFCPGSSTNVFYNTTGSYQSLPAECHLEHEVYLWVNGAWEELTMVNYRGQISEVEYNETAAVATGSYPYGVPTGMTAVITVESTAIREVLDYRWTTEDAQDVDTGVNISV